MSETTNNELVNNEPEIVEEPKYKMRSFRAGDIFYFSKIFGKLKLRLDFISKDLSNDEMGTLLIQKLIESLHLAEKEVMDFLGDLVGMSADDLANLPLMELINIITLFKDQKDIGDFLRSAAKLKM